MPARCTDPNAYVWYLGFGLTAEERAFNSRFKLTRLDCMFDLHGDDGLLFLDAVHAWPRLRTIDAHCYELLDEFLKQPAVNEKLEAVRKKKQGTAGRSGSASVADKQERARRAIERNRHGFGERLFERECAERNNG
jgi:hypothetical protein